MEIKNVVEQQDAVQLQIDGTVSITKDAIKKWYQEYCAEEVPTEPVSSTAGDKPDYVVGIVSDAHFDIEDSHNTEYMEDLKNALKYYEKAGVSFITSAGDLCQYKDKDLISFHDAYDSKLPFFTSMGNHDYLRIYEQKDASHQAPSGYKDHEDLWDKTVRSLAGNLTVHYFGTSYKDKLNYYFEKSGDLFVFISVDYGVSRERYDVIRAINQLDYSSKYVQQMTEYIKDTPYDRAKETKFDYQFYNPAVLIWLKELLESNPKKRIFLYMHHFLPAGGGDIRCTYRHLRIWPMPTPELVSEKFYSGSNTLCGLEFWFIEKLLRNHLNAVCFGGHSHYAAKEQEDVMYRAYMVSQPTGTETTPLVDNLQSLNGTAYDYKIYRPAEHSYAAIAPTVHIPSLAKPATREEQSLYGASEGAIMEVYKDKVILKYIRFKAEGSTTYLNEVIKTVQLSVTNDTSATVEPQVKPEGTFKGIKIVFNNQTGQDIRFAGKFLPYNQEEQYAMPFYLCPPQTVDDYCHWTENNYSLKAGEKKTFEFTELNEYAANKGKLVTKKISLSTIYGKHFRIADSAEWPNGIPAIKFGVRSIDRSNGGTSTGAGMVHAVPISESNCLIKEGGVYEIVLNKVKDNATFDKSWMDKPYSSGDKYKYVIL